MSLDPGQLAEIEHLSDEHRPAADEWDLDHDWCGQTADLAVGYLLGEQVAVERVDGAFLDGHPKVHAWLLLTDGTVLDPTVTQFMRGGPCPYGTVGGGFPGSGTVAVIAPGHPFASRYCADWRW